MSADIEAIRQWHQRSERGRCVRCRGPIEDCQFLQLADEIEALRKLDPLTIAQRVLTADILGEGIHTALGKCDGGHHAYRAIAAMPDDQWHRVMEFVALGLLEYIGREISEAQS